MTVQLPRRSSEEFLDLALAGDRSQAVRLALELLDDGVPLPVLLTDLIGAAQCEVGARWHRAEVTTADEHVVTGVSQAAVEALSWNARQYAAEGTVVVACAEGDWHSLPAQMFAEALRADGQGVIYLGASTPAEDVAALLERRRPDALAVTCNLALAYPGVVRLVDAAHAHGVPVLAGGRALNPARAVVLGADAWAVDVASAAHLLRTWRRDPPQVAAGPVDISLTAVELDGRAEEFGSLAYGALRERFPPMADYDQRQRARTREDLIYIVRYLAASRLVDDDDVFAEFTAWLGELLVARGVPVAALAAGLEVVAPLVRAVDEHGGELACAGAVAVG